MNEHIAQILNWEKCGASMPSTGWMQKAAADIVSDIWADNRLLIRSLRNNDVDFAAETRLVNACLEEAGAAYRFAEDDVRTGLTDRSVGGLGAKDEILELREWEEVNNYKTEDLVRERYNARTVEIDDAGDIRIADPMADRWLTDGELVEFVAWVRGRQS